MPTRNGSFRLFKLFGIDVFLHWSWFLVALYELQIRERFYSSINWNVLEYLTLFLIVLTHEFGHALACRSVGGKANQIVLWPLGGVAYVSPPQRPGPVLWSIVAGPLVNVVLFPILSVLWWIADSEWSDNLDHYLGAIWYINLIILVFNLLPIYPLDGGQILRALLWFFLGRARSLMTACIIGFIGAAGLAVFVIVMFAAAPQFAIWYAAICVFIFYNCFQGFKRAKELLRIDKAPRREDFRCPLCKIPPAIGDFWKCGKCRKKFDLFAAEHTCPHCSTKYVAAACFNCGMASRLNEWSVAPTPPEVPASANPS